MDRQAEQVIEINQTITVQRPKKEIPWKLIIFCTIFVGVFILFTVFPPAQRMVFEAKDYLQNQGWYGSVMLILIVGVFVVPLGLPYSMFQMMFALVVQEYWLALLATTAAETLGAAIAYVLTKYMLKDKLTQWMRKQQMFKGVEMVLSKNPTKFALVLRLTNFPLLIKNYALAINENIGFGVYIVTGVIGAVFNSAPQIYIFKQAEEISELFQHNNNVLSTFFTLFTTFLSLLIILYVICYTKKLMNQIQLELKSVQTIKVEGSPNKNVVLEKIIKCDIEIQGSDNEVEIQEVENHNIKLIQIQKNITDELEEEEGAEAEADTATR